MDFFTADTHFNDRRIITTARRPFGNVTQMNEALIDGWNEAVRPIDRVIHLGDFCKGGRVMVEWILNRLNGRKILLLGNHDRAQPPEFWKRAGFQEVHTHLDRKIDGRMIRYQHRPFPLGKIPAGIDAVLHGHIHDTRPAPPRHICLSVELHNYRPIGKEVISQLIEELLAIHCRN